MCGRSEPSEQAGGMQRPSWSKPALMTSRGRSTQRPKPVHQQSHHVGWVKAIQPAVATVARGAPLDHHAWDAPMAARRPRHRMAVPDLGGHGASVRVQGGRTGLPFCLQVTKSRPGGRVLS
jgi:hypothetical protein